MIFLRFFSFTCPYSSCTSPSHLFHSFHTCLQLHWPSWNTVRGLDVHLWSKDRKRGQIPLIFTAHKQEANITEVQMWPPDEDHMASFNVSMWLLRTYKDSPGESLSQYVDGTLSTTIPYPVSCWHIIPPLCNMYSIRRYFGGMCKIQSIVNLSKWNNITERKRERKQCG